MAVPEYIYRRVTSFRKKYGKVEEEVMEITKDAFGGEVERASNKEDMEKHIDFWWDSPRKGRIGIDVKGIKTNKDGEEDDSFQWLEFTNVRGNPGWLYGEEKYVAFKTFTQIVYIKTEVLRKYAEEKMGKKKPVTYRPDEYYVPYTRSKWGRYDVVIKVPMQDIIDLAKEKDEQGNSNGFFAIFEDKGGT